MATNVGLHEDLYFNLKILMFENYLDNVMRLYSAEYKGLEFNESSFYKSNPKAFQVVANFLITKHGRTSGEQFVNQIRPCFPCRDRRQEADFRKIVSEYIVAMQKDSKDEIFSGKLPISAILQNAGGDQFAALFLAVTNFIVMRRMSKIDNSVKRVFYLHEREDVEGIIENHVQFYEQGNERRNKSYARLHELGEAAIERYKQKEKDLAKAKEMYVKLASQCTQTEVNENVKIEDIISYYSHRLAEVMKVQSQLPNGAITAAENMNLEKSNGKVATLEDYNKDKFAQKIDEYRKQMKSFDQYLISDPNSKVLIGSDSFLQQTEKQHKFFIQQNSQLEAILRSLLDAKQEQEDKRQQNKTALVENPHLKGKLISVRHLFPSKAPTLVFRPVKGTKPRSRLIPEQSAPSSVSATPVKAPAYIAPDEEVNDINCNDISIKFDESVMEHLPPTADMLNIFNESVVRRSSGAVRDIDDESLLNIENISFN